MRERVVVLPSAVADPNPARREKLQAAARIFSEVVGSRRRFHGVTVHSFMNHCGIKESLGWDDTSVSCVVV